MEDFPILFLFLIIYLVAASSGKKKPKKKSPMRTRAQGEQADGRARRRDRQTREGFGDAFAERKVSQPVVHSTCDPRQMHLHEVSTVQMEDAQEGEDPCHVGGIEQDAHVQMDAAMDHDVQKGFQQDVLRGVIMSEILMRPDERRALQRKKYHG